MNLNAYLANSTILWHSSMELIRKFGKEQLNDLYKAGKIEIREGINCRVIKYKEFHGYCL